MYYGHGFRWGLARKRLLCRWNRVFRLRARDTELGFCIQKGSRSRHSKFLVEASQNEGMNQVL